MKRKILHENILKLFYHLGEADNQFFSVRTFDEMMLRRSIPLPELQGGIKALVAKNMLIVDGKGYKLSEAGLKDGQRITRLHRLWELYLSKYLRIEPDHVHDDAEAIEHIITPEIEQKLLDILGKPIMDPHNVEIPYTKSN
ncbi:MAG: hypothetical protein HKN75_04920 [Bacteroidia bacterium]|nr:hypothetical protein [Bacteroidia bacterium]